MQKEIPNNAAFRFTEKDSEKKKKKKIVLLLQKNSSNLLNDPQVYVCVCVCVYEK